MELKKLSGRPRRGELLARAMEIPLAWPEHEYPADRSMAEQFEKALATWGGRVHRVENDSDVVAKAGELIAAAEAKKISRWRSPALEKLDWERGLAHLKLEWILPSPEEIRAAETHDALRAIRNRLAKIDVGITECDHAVAHTGTVAVRHGPDRDGFTNLLPWTNIVIVRMSQMVRTLQDLIDKLDSERRANPFPPSFQFITGPSRSGDIDLTVGQGAAGPGQYHVILIQS